MKNLFSHAIWALFFFLTLGCSQDLTAVDEMDENSPQVLPNLNSKLAANPPADEESYAHVTLSTSKSLASQMTSERTVYEVVGVHDMNGGSVELPANCVLSFNGGKIKNGTITFNKTYMKTLTDRDACFSNCSYAGTLTNIEVVASWFGATPSNKDNSQILNEVIAVIPETLVFDTIYPINNTVAIGHHVTFRGLDWEESVYGINLKTAEYGIRTSSHITAIKFNPHGRLNAYGISIIGDEILYTGGNTRDKEGPNGGPIQTAGIMMSTGRGSIGAIFDCAIVGFTWGIKSVGGYIEKIRSTYFSSNRFGIYCCYTSDFSMVDCHFNTNMINYDCSYHGLEDNNPDGLRKVGAGALIKGTGMVQFIGCRFEFNFINLILDEANTITNVEDCIFDAPNHSHIMVYNDDKDNMVDPVDRHYPSINCVNISGNTFVRGARLEHNDRNATPGSCIVYVRESNNRGTNFSFNNNVVADKIENNQTDVKYEPTIFKIYNDGESGVINSNGNDFSRCEATSVATVVSGSTGRFVIKDSGSNFGNISHRFTKNTVLDIQKMEVGENGKIIIWNTLTTGNRSSEDIIIDPTK